MGKTRESGELLSNNLLSADHSSQTVNVGSAITFYGGTTGIISATSFSGSGANLTNLPAPTPADTDVQVTYDISANSNNYRITGPGYDASENNPDLYLVRGQRYRFINGTGSGHPFRIQSNTSGTQYTDGVSGDQDGTQDFNVQNDAPSRLYYQCTIHGGMIGNIYITGGADWRMTDVTTAQTPKIFTNLNVGIGTDNPVGNLEVRDSKANLIVAKDGLTVKSNSDLHTTYDMLQIGAGGALASYSTATATADTQLLHNAYRHSGGTQKYRYADTATRIMMNSPGGSFRFQNAASGSADADITFTERLRITSDGNVGIGTEIPLRQLEVFSTGHATAAIKGSDQSSLFFVDGDDSNIGQISYIHNQPSGDNDYMYFRVNDAERLRITSGGRVNIGQASSVDHTLCVAGTDNTTSLTGGHNQGIQLQNKSTTDGTYSQIEWRTSNGGRYARIAGIQDDANGNGGQLVFLTETSGGTTTERLRITSAGYLGIGNTVPRGIVHVGADLASGATDAAAINLKQTSTTAATGIYLERSGERRGYAIYVGGDLDSLNFQRNNVGTKSDVMTMTRDGKIGIGTGNPSTALHLLGADTYLTMQSSSASGNAGILFKDSGGTQNGVIFYDFDDDFLKFSTNDDSEALRINSNGDVNIGNKNHLSHSSSVDSLQIGYALNLYEDSYTSGTNNYVVLGNNVYYNSGNKYMRNDEASRIMMNAGNFYFQSAAAGTAGNAVTFTDRLSITSEGYVTKPNQPSFQCIKSGHHTFTSNTVTTIASWTEKHDVGNDFNATTGVFTAPVTGKYYFYVSVMQQRGGNGDFQLKIYKNGSLYVNSNDMNDAATTTFQQTTVSAIVHLPLNDTVTFRTRNSTDTTSFIYQGAYTHCGGYLIG